MKKNEEKILAKTLKEAINYGLGVGPLANIIERTQGEIRDFFAHEVARYCKRNNCMDQYDILSKFVSEILSDMPAVKDSNEKN